MQITKLSPKRRIGNVRVEGAVSRFRDTGDTGSILGGGGLGLILSMNSN